jgi:hypothetical protein
MSLAALSPGFKISINSLYTLREKDLDIFLSQNSVHQKTLSTFLIQKKPETLEKAASDLIQWFNDNQFTSLPKVAITEDTKIIAKEILIMHATGKLSGLKHFLFTHELGHAHDHGDTKSLGDFEPRELDFIKSHQYGEMRADLTAAREDNAHELGIAYFEWRSIIAGQPPESDSHPTDANRAKAIKLDHEKILKAALTTSSSSTLISTSVASI